MTAVFYMEFRRQILSFRSIFFILLFIILGISLERLFSMTSTEIGFIDNETYAGSFFVIIKFAVILLGYLFSSILSHNCINRETGNKSARLVISKVSKVDYIIGKYLANALFWIACFIAIYIFLFFRYGKFDLTELIMNVIAMLYYNSIVILVSVITQRSISSNFLGLVIGIVLPFLGLLALAKNSLFKYFFPYAYMLELNITILLLLLIIFSILSIAILIFKRTDL